MPLPKHGYTADDYWNLPDGVRAELIDGKLWDLASPSRKHQRIATRLSARLVNFIDAHKGSCEVYSAPFAVNLFADDTTFVEPDISVICDHDKLSDRGCEGAPDLVVEVISPSISDMDYISKFKLYFVAGVREYWICDPIRERTSIYVFENDPLPTIYPFDTPAKSTIFPGLEVKLADIVAGM